MTPLEMRKVIGKEVREIDSKSKMYQKSKESQDLLFFFMFLD